jgi:citrate lyase subunit beta/citryl-CoA lyase
MRSLLFVPAHDARKLAKGLACGADALIVDLEDAVPPAEKTRARGLCAEFVAEHRSRLPLFVRINALDTGLALADLEAVVRAQPFGIMLPKCAGGHDVARLDAHIAALEARDDLRAAALRILPIATETAASLFGMHSYARQAGARLCGLMWGAEDLASDVGAVQSRRPDGRYAPPFELARSLTLMAAGAAQVPAIDAVFTDFRDIAGLKAEALQALRDGFSAKAAIHPDQIGPIHEAFTPTADDIARARRVLAAFDEQPGAGAIALDGRMLDRPHQRAARRVLDRAAAPQPS